MLEKITKANIQEAIIKSKKKSVLIFKSESCPHCRKMTPVVEDLAKEMGENIKFGYVDVAEDADLAVDYGITGVPTTLIFENGVIKHTIVGFQPKEKVKEVLK